MILADAVKKFDLRALYLPDRKRILIDDSIPSAKHRWLEAHEIGHDILPWHHDMMLGDDDFTPTASVHEKMEAEANFAAGSLLFLGDRFITECKDMEPSIENAKILKKRYGNTFTTTLWRIIEHAGEETPIIGFIGQHPNDFKNCEDAFRHIIPSRKFNEHFDIPSSAKLVDEIQGYCYRSRGPLGADEVQLTDKNGQSHFFSFESFYNGYDTLTLAVHKCAVPSAICVSF